MMQSSFCTFLIRVLQIDQVCFCSRRQQYFTLSLFCKSKQSHECTMAYKRIIFAFRAKAAIYFLFLAIYHSIIVQIEADQNQKWYKKLYEPKSGDQCGAVG